MLDMGIQAINNVAQIVAFLKIDEVRYMIAVQDSESLFAKANESNASKDA